MEFGGNDWNNDGVYDHLDSHMDYELSKTSDKSCNSSGGATTGTSSEMIEQHTRVKDFWALPVLLFVFFGANLGVWIWVIYKLVTGLGEA